MIPLSSRLGPLAVFICLCALAACGPKESGNAVLSSPPGPVAAEPQRPGDPAKGKQALLEAPYIDCGLPYKAFEKSGGMTLDAPKLPERSGRNGQLPYLFTAHTTKEGVELISPNCLACHGGFFDGKLVMGLGNENLDFSRDRSVVVEAAGAYVQGEAEAKEWRRWADVVRTTAPFEYSDTLGANTAIHTTLAVMAHRDPKTLAWSDQPLMEPPPKENAPVSVPPWWRLAKKNALYYNSEGRGDLARAMMLGAIYCADNVETLKKIDAYAPDIRAFFASIQPPRWPFAVDASLAERGRGVFETTCSGCHGTYGPNGSYPNRVVAAAEAGTDPVIADEAAGKGGERFVAWFNRSWFGETSRAAPAKGYIAPPLDGVWVTAPYLHNGSVPNIAALLDSKKRPAYWTRSFRSDAADYDAENLGWRHQALDHGVAGVDDPAERKRIYDTTRRGYSNGGHTFGDGLSEGDRKAVLEYLKTL